MTAMTPLRKLACGRACTIRLPGICNGNPETVVLCHYRLVGFSGSGMKSPDWLAAYGCSACHAAVDSQTKIAMLRADRQLALAEAVFRTLDILIGEGVIVVSGMTPRVSKIAPRAA